jgi:threonine dehydrogenase-like Zn-dependent dehydrogenase/plasmid stabilization system protein ParE
VKIRYTPKALAQLDAIYSYIEAHNPRAATAVKARIQRAIGRLARFPYCCRATATLAFAYCQSCGIRISFSTPSTKQSRRCRFSGCVTARGIPPGITTDELSMHGKALWYVAPDRAELREEPVAAPLPGQVLVRALHGAISRGTERLVYNGRVPASEYERMRAPLMGGTLPFPVKYGYAAVGRVEAGPADLEGRLVFSLHPHQSLFTVAAAMAIPVPEVVPPQRAVLAANMETALNAVWDGSPGPADRIAVVGGGLLGLLIAYLCARLPGAEVTVVDIAPQRAALAHALGARFAVPDAAPLDRDLVFHTSASAAGLATALRLAGEETSVIELSWYGIGDVAVPLGEAFHSRRLRLISSQVGKVAPSHRLRWSYSRRLAAALGLLTDSVLDALLAPPISFEDLPAKLPEVFSAEAGAVCPLIRYPTGEDSR